MVWHQALTVTPVFSLITAAIIVFLSFLYRNRVRRGRVQRPRVPVGTELAAEPRHERILQGFGFYGDYFRDHRLVVRRGANRAGKPWRVFHRVRLAPRERSYAKQHQKGEPNKSGKIKEELIKRLDGGGNLYFRYETIYN